MLAPGDGDLLAGGAVAADGAGVVLDVALAAREFHAGAAAELRGSGEVALVPSFGGGQLVDVVRPAPDDLDRQRGIVKGLLVVRRPLVDPSGHLDPSAVCHTRFSQVYSCSPLPAPLLA